MEKDISKYIGRRIRYFRDNRGMTQKELGEKVGVKHNTISLYESGTNSPGENIMFAIAQALGVNINDLYPPIKGELSLVINKAEDYVKPYNPIALTMVPIVGRISCGSGVLAYEDAEGYEPIPDEWLNGGEHFCLRAKGDSMIGARIHEGDLLLIREQPEVENGEIAAVLIDDEAVLKRIYINNDQLVLQSENPNYSPILSPPTEVTIIGKLKKIIINV